MGLQPPGDIHKEHGVKREANDCCFIMWLGLLGLVVSPDYNLFIGSPPGFRREH